MKVSRVVLALSIILLSSCRETREEEKTSPQMDEVMAIHDEVMPKMAAIGRLVGQLKAKTDSVEGNAEYETAMKDLQEAHKAMMDWMQGFGNRFDSEEILDGKELTEEKKQWLDEEEQKVRALREQINSSIKKAEEVLSSGSGVQ